jgi:hypothetical protein
MGAAGMGAVGMDMNSIFQSERENIELVKHEWILENIESRILKKESRKGQTASKAVSIQKKRQ